MEIIPRLGKLITACCVCCGCFTSAAAQQAAALEPLLRAEVGAAGTTANLSWSVAGNSAGTSPNIMSELQWRNLLGAGMYSRLTFQPLRRWYATLGFAGMGYAGGHATDNDYQEDNRQYPSYAGRFSANKGYFRDFNSTIGFVLHASPQLKWLIQSGYTNQQQLNYLLPADQFTPSDLRSTYASKWKGLIMKTTAEWLVSGNTSLVAGMAYSQLWYHAEADWNLIPSFRHPLSFMHAAKGYAVHPTIEMKIRMFGKAYLNLELAYDYRITGYGAEHLYLHNGDVTVTRLNNVRSSCWTLRAGLPFTLIH